MGHAKQKTTKGVVKNTMEAKAKKKAADPVEKMIRFHRCCDAFKFWSSSSVGSKVDALRYGEADMSFSTSAALLTPWPCSIIIVLVLVVVLSWSFWLLLVSLEACTRSGRVGDVEGLSLGIVSAEVEVVVVMVR